MKLVLDTNIYIDFAQGRQDIVDLMATRSTEILLPSIVPGELYFGFAKGNRSRYNETKLRHFVNTLKVLVIVIDEEVARKYALIFCALTARGARIPINDVWIAASCMSVGGTLVTRDRHFEQVEQIDKLLLT
jgi:tRNA(fMet)-specific endonuclease VapC